MKKVFTIFFLFAVMTGICADYEKRDSVFNLYNNADRFFASVDHEEDTMGQGNKKEDTLPDDQGGSGNGNNGDNGDNGNHGDGNNGNGNGNSNGNNGNHGDGNNGNENGNNGDNGNHGNNNSGKEDSLNGSTNHTNRDARFWVSVIRLLGFISTDGYGGYHTNYVHPFGAFWRSFTIPGWGQCYKGKYMKGWLYLGSSIAFSAAEYHNMIIYFNRYDALSLDGDNADLKKSVDKAQDDLNYLMIGHIALWVFNIIDATFFDWDEINLSLTTNERQQHYLTLNLEF